MSKRWKKETLSLLPSDHLLIHREKKTLLHCRFSMALRGRQGGGTMRYTKIILPIGLAALVVMALGVGPTLAQSTSGSSPFLASTSIGGGVAAPFMLLTKGHGMGHRGFRGGLWFGGYPGYYGYWGGYPQEYTTNPSTTCVWNGYKYNCYNFPSERLYVY
jgi:hypothetical protein